MQRAPKEAECAEGGIEECARGSKIRLFQRVEDSGKRAWEEQRVAWSSSERKVIAAVEDYLERCAEIKSGHGGFGAHDGARRSGGLSMVHPEVRDEKMQQYFLAL